MTTPTPTTPWTKLHPLSDQNAFICLVDHMGDDSSIVQAARVSYGKDDYEERLQQQQVMQEFSYDETMSHEEADLEYHGRKAQATKELQIKDRQLIRYLMNHSHTTPFEMVEIKFMVQVPMDCWRQWIRHRTASVNEYSTRYTEALDMQQTTLPGEWRLQATDNKQGSSGFLEEWPEDTKCYIREDGWLCVHIDTRGPGSGTDFIPPEKHHFTKAPTVGEYLSWIEEDIHNTNDWRYKQRLALGVAKEQARKDLPLSTYTRAYWKCDLHNIFNFLRLRMDSHAQLEIRQFANAMFEIVRSICPVACEAFEDYVLHAKKFSKMEMDYLRTFLSEGLLEIIEEPANKPSSMTDREWKEFLGKLS